MVKIKGVSKRKGRKKFQGKGLNKHISLKLIKCIQKFQMDLQREENIRNGRKANHISFLEASDYVSRCVK